MSNVVNIQRDSFWTTLKDTDEVAFSTESLISGGSLKVNGDSTVYDDKISVRPAHDTVPVVTAGTSWEAIGGYLSPGYDDNTPYRVKLNMNSVNFVGGIAVGYAPASITGTDDVIDPVAVFHVQNNFDEVLMLPHLESGDTYYGRAICFAFFITYNTGAYGSGALSVQKLSVKPPTMLLSTS